MAKYRLFPFSDRLFELLAPERISPIDAISQISDMLHSKEPFMISRFGSTELQTLCYVKYFPLLWPLKRRIWHIISNNSGFFPVSFENLRLFYDRYKEDSKEIDVLVSWRVEELFIKNWIKNTVKIDKSILDGFYMQFKPWTQALTGKKILVVHPFADTIQAQYQKNRKFLFTHNGALPEFATLEIVKAVQSIAGNVVDFDTWFDALDSMKIEIDKCDYDVALLGCGAYGLPLAAHIKRSGKQAIHMGGILQLLFGILGKRYLNNNNIKSIVNEYFTFPNINERPANSEHVEGGCYW